VTPAAGVTGGASITLAVSDGNSTSEAVFAIAVVDAEHKLYLPLLVR
jgi:hypothetical protein